MKYRNKEWLENQYLTLKKSARDIAKECNVDPGTIGNWLKKFGIKTRTNREANILKEEPKPYMDKDWLYEQYVDLQRSITDLANEFNCSTATIVRYMKFFEIESRDRSEALKIAQEKKHFGFDKGNIPWNKGMVGFCSGEKHYKWKGGRLIHNGYILVLKPEHPFANNNGYVREHRLVMEAFLKTYLTSEQIVHHEDGNTQNNQLDNLMLFESNSEHAKYHAKKRREMKKMKINKGNKSIIRSRGED